MQQNVAYHMSQAMRNDEQHCTPSTDSNLEAFSRYPTDSSFAASVFQLATLTKYLKEVFPAQDIKYVSRWACRNAQQIACQTVPDHCELDFRHQYKQQ